MAPAPGSFHQQISGNLFFIFMLHVRKGRLGRVFAAPLEVILDAANVVQPDLVFVSVANSNFIQPHGVTGRPDAVVEIISGYSVQRDRLQKKDLYEKFGVPEYWLVDAANRAIEVFVLTKGKYRPYAFAVEKGKVKSKIITGLEVDLAEAFA